MSTAEIFVLSMPKGNKWDVTIYSTYSFLQNIAQIIAFLQKIAQIIAVSFHSF